MIVNAINESWNLAFGIPGTGYYADNGTEFKNIKMDELVSKLGISIRNRKKKEETMEGEKGNVQNWGLANLVFIGYKVKYFNVMVFYLNIPDIVA